MKVMYFWIYLTLCSSTLSMLSFADNEPLNSIDMTKAEKDEYTKFIHRLYWPSDKVIAKKRISKELVHGEIEEFKNMLRTVLKAAYLPSEEVVDSEAVAVKKLSDNNDYILLKYERDACRHAAREV